MVGPLPSKHRNPSAPGRQSAARDAGYLAHCDEGVAGVTSIALWMAAAAVGVMAAALIGQAPLLGSLMRRLCPRGAGGGRASPHTPRRKAPRRRSPGLPLLAEAIVGSSKAAVARALGPPHCASFPDASDLQGATFWLADTWYYPMPSKGPTVLAIRFADDSARAVELIRA